MENQNFQNFKMQSINFENMPKYHLAIQSFLVHQGIFLLQQLPKNKREKKEKKKKERRNFSKSRQKSLKGYSQAQK